MADSYDVIVVGARCAGSPTAMLLSRRGYRVLVVDRARFPSDTLSTHVLHPSAVARLAGWGLLERLVTTGCPPVHTYAFDFGPLVLSGSPGTDEMPVAYCPRRTILDALLVEAAREAGAEVREGFTVERIVIDDGRVVGIEGHDDQGRTVSERARIVIGADGRHSSVAHAVEAPRYHERPPLQAAYYAYFSGLPLDGRFETYIRPRRGFAAVPTHDGLTLVVAGWPYAEFSANKKDVEGTFFSVIDLVPHFAARVRSARREARFAGAAVPNFFRKPYGPGWALVGDAGYIKDPITAQGMNDAFGDAERCAAAVDEWLGGARAFDDAMATYQSDRDEAALPMYELTCQIASHAPPPPEMQALLGAIQGDQEAMDLFVKMNAATIPPAAFFGSDVVRARMAASTDIGARRTDEVA